MDREQAGTGKSGFTLTELLVVLVIIGLVAAFSLPTIVGALGHRQVSEAGRILQGLVIGARDQAIHDGQPSGIRLLPDSTLAGCYSRAIPIGPAPDYMEGMARVRVDVTYSASVAYVPALVLEEATVDANGVPVAPTSWMWNIRVGDKVQLGGAGVWYTVIGPIAKANGEMFVNVGLPGTASPIGRDYLLLTNGRDDNGNGLVDEGWDGIDNNGTHGADEYLPGVTDTVTFYEIDPTITVGPNTPTQFVPITATVECNEWETETWVGAAAQGLASVPYVIRRRAAPMTNAREIALPTQIVIEAARSQLPVGPDGTVDLLIRPDGTAYASTCYGVPSAFSLTSAFFHFALIDRTDAGTGVAPVKDWSMFTLNARTGRTVVIDQPDSTSPFAAGMQGVQ